MKSIYTIVCSRFIALTLFFLLFSCQEFVEDCLLWPHRAEISTDLINSGTVGEFFERTIQCGTENSVLDDQYTYDISLQGDLPAGVTYSTTARQLILSGTPTEYGTYDITITCVISDPDATQYEEGGDSDRICGSTNETSKDFSFNIESF